MFPAYLPKGCPPADAVEAKGDFFHLVSSNPLRSDAASADCRSKCEKDEPGSDGCVRCNGCGLSVFPSEREARQQYAINAERFPRIAMKYMGHIAKATLTPAHGKVKVTGGSVPNHTTWWFAESLDVPARCKLFVVVASSVQES